MLYYHILLFLYRTVLAFSYLHADPPFYPWKLVLPALTGGITIIVLGGLTITGILPIWLAVVGVLCVPLPLIPLLYRHANRLQPPGWNPGNFEGGT